MTLHLRPSSLLTAALVFAHALAAASLAPLLEFPLAVRLALLCGLSLSLVLNLRRHRWQIPVRTLTLGGDGSLQVEWRDATRSDAVVHPQTTVFPWLCVLRVQIDDGRSLALTLPPDALKAEEHRQLRLWLRWKAASSAPASVRT